MLFLPCIEKDAGYVMSQFRYQNMEIDHIIPDSLEETRELNRIFEAFNLPKGFTLQSYENWLPAHRRCNRKKRALVFKTTPIIQAHLELAAKSAPKAKELEERYGSDRRIDKAVQELCVAHEKGDLNEKHRQKLIAIFGPFHERSREPEERGKPILIAPGLEDYFRRWVASSAEGPHRDGWRSSKRRQSSSELGLPQLWRHRLEWGSLCDLRSNG